MSDAGKEGGIASANFCMLTEFELCDESFEAVLSKIGDNMVMQAAWRNDRQQPFGLARLMGGFDVRLPAFFCWEIIIERCSLSYYTKSKKAAFRLSVKDYGTTSLATYMEGRARAYELNMQLDSLKIAFAALPVIGRLLLAEDGLCLDTFGVKYTPGDKLILYLDGKLVIGGRLIALPLSYERDIVPPQRAALPGEAGGGSDPLSETSVAEVKWFDVDKTFKILTVMRIGFAMQDSKLKLCIDARLKLAILDVEVYEMYVSLSLAGDWKAQFGISGLMVSLEKPPVTIAGGLYKAPDEPLYNGKLVLGFGKYALTALGSYGELEDGTVSFFLYLMLDYPLGGPPIFFVTGLALGFALNRKLRLPELKEMEKFPLVAAAMGRQGSGLSPESKPAEALNALSDWISPSQGDYFVTAGVRFESFGMVKSFLLATVEFGSSLRISLLGLSTVSMPPNVQDGKKPIAYAQLAIRATISPDEGTYEVIGALTQESYILDQGCRLTGGFAFCMWTKGAYAGDFLVTLGGCHHPLFQNKHYPVLDKVGINWVIQKGLVLVADGYFALTPNCLMAGARMELSYTSGSFRAWVRASMELLMQWKPFFYDISMSVSIGVSFILIFKRVNLEIGASLHVWGPEFAGTVTIHVLFFHITIRFGKQKKTVEPDLTWQEFQRDFLSDESAGNAAVRAAAGAPLCSICISDGLIREAECFFVVKPDKLKITTHSKLPSNRLLKYGWDKHEQDADYVIEQSAQKLGIVPMGKTSLAAKQIIRVERLSAEGSTDVTLGFRYTKECENLSPALWAAAKPGMNDAMIQNALMGVSMRPKEEVEGMFLPQGQTGYRIKELLAHEISAKKETSWRRADTVSGTDYRGSNALEMVRSTLISNTGRDEMLEELTALYGTPQETRILGLGSVPEDYLYANPVLRTTGAGKAE